MLLLLGVEKCVHAVPLEKTKSLECAPHQGIEVLFLPPGLGLNKFRQLYMLKVGQSEFIKGERKTFEENKLF